VQTSGNTIAISRPDDLPLHNLPVLACDFELGDVVDKNAIAAAVRNAISNSDIEEGSSPVALAFPWSGDPSHARLHALAAGICSALAATLAAGLPIVLMIDGDVGMSSGASSATKQRPAPTSLRSIPCSSSNSTMSTSDG